MQLSPQQLHRFQTDGFLLLRNFAPASLCDAIREAAEEEMALQKAPIESEEEYLGAPQGATVTLRRLRQVYQRHPLFQQWMHYDPMRPILHEILGEKPILTLAHHNSIMTKMPGKSTETCWHQDIRYWRFDSTNLISVWLALGEERMENGVLEFVPGSHKLSLKPEQFDQKVCFMKTPEENRKILSRKVHFDLNPGDVVLFHALTLHHAYENQTDKPKISFVYTVRGESVRPVAGSRSAKGEEVAF
ncbi:MAG: phytanoyl-CoA dioxygenase family protein [Sulfurospirillum sp.]|nr:MAG: phytanoyl-CoA dioxygenase family protein [Sulfurospirillum sp.]